MDGNSLDVKQDLISKLKLLIPSAFTEGDKLDTEKLKQVLGDEINTDNERYFLNWAGKSEVFNVLQTPTTATLAPDINESINFNTTENIFIEGENLEVLKVLQKSYYGKIKMIYIDPPYNTGSDSFIYPDKFEENKNEYLKRIEEKDEEGFMMKEGFFRKNSKDSGHYHSNWLSMMYPRLFLARNLLQDNGVIFISIDDNEIHNLKLLMNEIFGEENFRNAIIIKRGAKSVQMQFETVDKLGSGYETVLMYTKNADHRFPRIEKELKETKLGTWNNHWRGTDRPSMRYELFGIKPDSGQWRWGEKRSLEAIDNYKRMLKELNKTEETISLDEIDGWWVSQYENNGLDVELLRVSKNGKPEHYIPPSDTRLDNDVWFNIPPNSTSVLKSIFKAKIFDNPKPLELIQRCMEICTSENDIVLDFFAGSGTTAHSLLELNKEDGKKRKFILNQLPELTLEASEAYKAGYKTIADICKERIRRVIQNYEKEKKRNSTLFEGKDIDLGLKVLKLKNSNFKIWRSDAIENGDDLKNQMEVFKDPVKKETKELNLIFELILKLGFDLNTKIEKETNDFTFYRIDNDKLLIFIGGNGDIRKSIKESSEKYSPEKVIALDSLFEGSDEAKTNVMLQLKDAGIEFSSI